MTDPGGRMLATIDIGTNTLLLLIAELRDGQLVVVHEDCQFGRLGQGLDSSGRLDETAIERSLAMLRRYREKIDEYPVAHIAAVGTQALREAQNARDFLEPAREILGNAVQVIHGEREAELAYAAAARSFPDLARDTMIVIDVGGGSTEIITGRASRVESWRSLAIGSVRLAERHLVNDPPEPREARALITDIDRAISGVELPQGAPIIGTAGTATALASVEQKLTAYEPERVHGTRLSRAVVERQLATYLQLTLAERRRMRGLEPARADVIPAGAAIFSRLLHRAEADELVICDRGVRWGLAYELADQSM
jgi:exopolyphosphatase / guanosine-5'-triphosphate,3'-diphosphate pyrophosphatase